MGDMTGLSSFSDDLALLDDLLDTVLKGGKPVLDPENKTDKLFIEYLHNLYPENFDRVYERSLDTRPEGYYITPEQQKNGQDKLVKQVNTQIHPLHDELKKLNHSIAGRASKIQLYNFAVAGADMHFRDQRDYEDLYDRSPNLLLHEKGDVVSLSQTVKLLREVVDGEDRSNHAVLIDNTTERFTPILKMLGLDYPEAVDNLNQKLEKNTRSLRLAVVEEKNTALGRMKAIAFDGEKKLPVLPQIMPEQVFQATSSQEKIDDVRRALSDHRSNITISDAKVIGGQSEHDPEFQYTYAGNDYAKGVLTILDKQENPHVENVLNAMGLSKDNTGILFYDGGELYAERGLAETDVFKSYIGSAHPFIEFPGADTKPISQTVGTNSDYYKVVEQAFEEIRQKENRDVDTRILDNCVSIYMPLEQEDMSNPRYYAYKATTVQEFDFKPDPMAAANMVADEFKNQRHYQRPIDRVENLASLEDESDQWMLQDLAIAKAVRGFSDACRVPKRKLDPSAEFNKVANIVVECPYPVPAEYHDRLTEKLGKRGLSFSAPEKPMRSIAEVRDTVKKADALIFPNVGVEKEKNFWVNRMLTPASAVVDKQLSGVQIPIAFWREGNKLSEFERVANHYKKANLVAQDVRHLYRGADRVKKNAAYITESLMHSESFGEFEQHKKIALPKRDKAVVFLESASSTHPVDLQNSYELAVNCGLNGYDNVSGFGMSGPMGMVSWAGMQLRREGWTDHVVMGAQDPNAMKTEGAPFEAMRAIMGNGYGVVSPDIYERMWQMLQMDELQKDPGMETIAVAQGCGIGGLQEISFVMALKELGVPGAERISLIIENAERELPSGVISPHDALLDIMEERGDLDEGSTVYATTSPEETIQAIGEIQDRDMFYMPIQNPIDTIHPFEVVKNPLYNWLMDRGDWTSPEKTIKQAVNEHQYSMVFQQHLQMG